MRLVSIFTSPVVRKNASIAVCLLVGAAVAVSSLWWIPWLRKETLPAHPSTATAAEEGEKTPGGKEADAPDDHAGHSAATTLDLSAQALKNVGYKPLKITIGPYTRRLAIPAIVTERPGQSTTNVPAMMSGVVTKVHVIEGQAVKQGEPLFELRLTHEELVTAQRDFLQQAAELGVLNKEVKRLEAISAGIIAGKRILELKYEQEKIRAAMLAHRQGLKLHGLSDAQIDGILSSNQLVQTLTVFAPPPLEACNETPSTGAFQQVQNLAVSPGQQVSAGDRLCTLADHCLLFLEGKAFEADIEALTKAASQKWPIAAAPVAGSEQPLATDLQIYRLANQVDVDTRAFHVYLLLPNKIVRDESQMGRRFVGWKFKPGQRMEVQIPVARLENKIVVPSAAVVDEGAESYVFQQNGSHFDRISVHVEQRDKQQVVLASDGSLFPGDIIAGFGAYQMQLALKNKSGGAIDPHAGHSH